MKKAFIQLALAFGLVCPAQAQASPPEVQIDTGEIRGARDGATEVFKGIPYAMPPVANRRWAPPTKPAEWDGVRDATAFGAACPQPPGREEAWAQVGPTSEDCLFLNVWRPVAPGTYPVMVFLHGGGFTYGAAGIPLYDGANLARHDVVVVTLNYRLGRLGYFAHPALTADDPEGPLGNYGIMDQVEALRWVQRNIAAFDGDPGNVTLFGESAGAGTVQLLMASPEAEGLFHKAISQSGAGGAILPRLDQVEVMAQKAVEAAGLKDPTAAQLRSLPLSAVMGRSFPLIDGKVVVASPGTPFLRGDARPLPLMIGANSFEATLTSNSEEATREVLGDRYEAFARDYAAARSGSAEAAAKVDLAEDTLSILPSVSIAALHSATGAPTFSYYFDQVPASLRAEQNGTAHGGELEYLFGNPYDGAQWDEADEKASQLMSRYWVNFAKTGDPNGAGLPMWPQSDTAERPAYLTISSTPAADELTPLEDEVRRVSLDHSTGSWNAEP